MKEEEPQYIEPSIPEIHGHKFIPLWMAVAAFALIVLAYLCCHIAGYNVNVYREVGTIGISGFFAILCAYFDKKPE